MSTEPAASHDWQGDPNCPLCGGVGYIRQDLPINHPDFGKLQICTCRQKTVAQMAHERLYRLSNLEAFKHFSFDNFSTQGRTGLGEEQISSLTSAHHTSRQFAQTLNGWLLLMGTYGCGKTHLAAAIANFAVQMGVPTLFLTVPDLLDWLRFSYGNSETNFETRFDEIRNIQLLVLDDLGTQNTTAWAQEKLFQIINHRYVNRFPLVLTTNQSLEEVEGRIRSRLRDPELVTRIDITAPDYRSNDPDTSYPPLSSLHLHTKQGFGEFSTRESEKLPPEQQRSLLKAFEAAQQFAENPRSWLVFMGDYATGKTHLAAAIGNYRHALGTSPMFVVTPDLLDHLRATFNPNSTISYDRLFNDVRTASLLILDDLGTQSATPWAKEKLYQILNYRYNAELPTVITTASPMDELDPRITSRMLDKRICNIYYMDVPSYRPKGPIRRTTKSRRKTST